FQAEVVAPLEQSEPKSEDDPEALPAPEPMARPLGRSIRVAHTTKAKTATTEKSANTAEKKASELPAGWPDARGFVPAPPCAGPPLCHGPEKILPVLEHTKTYNGQDAEFTAALASFASFQDDARFGGWQGYLERSDDFMRFCCLMHVYELLG